MRPWSGLLVLMVLVPMLYACGDGAATAGDCSIRLRLDEVVYTSVGRTADGAVPRVSRLGEAERARCEDVGRDARGSHFTDDPDELDLVEVWSLTGHDPAQVIGTPSVDGNYDLYFAETLTDPERQALETDLLAG